jgi:hypothetical protein
MPYQLRRNTRATNLRRDAILWLPAIIPLTGGLPHAALAQNPLGVAVSGLVAKDVINDASKAADDAIGHAQMAGSALISQGASQLAVLEQNAGLIMAGDLDKFGRDLSVDEENLLGQVYSLTQQVKAAKDGAYKLKDSTAIDVASLTGALPFVKVPYFIQRIDGLAHVNSDSDYHMDVAAYGITPGTEGSASEVTVINASTKTIIPTTVSVTHKGEAQVIFANATLASMFDSKKVVVLPVILTVTVVDTKGFIIHWHKKTQITAKVALSLFPKVAGTVTVTAFIPQYAWKRMPQGAETEHRREGDGEPDPFLTQNITVPGGLTNPQPGYQHLENVMWHCNAWWSGRRDVCGYQAYWRMISPPSITNDGTEASWSMKSNGESREFWITAEKYSYDYTGDATDTKTYDLFWGRSQTIDMPSKVTHYSVQGQTITKQSISLTGHQSMGDFMTFVGQTGEPDPTISYQIGTPGT